MRDPGIEPGESRYQSDCLTTRLISLMYIIWYFRCLLYFTFDLINELNPLKKNDMKKSQTIKILGLQSGGSHRWTNSAFGFLKSRIND